MNQLKYKPTIDMKLKQGEFKTPKTAWNYVRRKGLEGVRRETKLAKDEHGRWFEVTFYKTF